MDLIKKHFEKILLALAFVILIGVAGFLAFRVSRLSEEISEAPELRRIKGKVVSPTPITDYTNAITGLQTPAAWPTNALDLFGTEMRIVPLETVETQVVVVVAPPEPFELIQIIRKPFKLVFLDYLGQGENFQVNFPALRRTFMVPKVGDNIADPVSKFDTGYVITDFERKQVVVEVPGIGPRTNDVSELTVQFGNDAPIVLVRGKVTEQEPLADITCVAEGRAMRVRPKMLVACAGKTYNVVDITSTQVIILDQDSKERHTISRAGVRE